MTPNDFIDHLDALLDRDELSFAFDALCAIRKTVADSRRVTASQEEDVRNIVQGQERTHAKHEDGEELPTERLNDGFSRRRYEGS